MVTTTRPPAEELSVARASLRVTVGGPRRLAAVAILALVVGAACVLGGLVGAATTVHLATAADTWVDEIPSATALGLGILSTAVSAFAVVVGLVLSALGWVVLRLRRATVALT